MRIAIFGGGSIGSRHATNARALGHTVRVYDLNSDRGLAFGGFKAGDADAALICTPADSHEPMAEFLYASRGYHGPLFVEKPLMTMRDQTRIRPTVFGHWPHPVTMVGYNLRFHPAVDFLRQGRPTSGELTLDCDSRLWPGGGYAGLLEECSHEIDLALHLGAPADVTGGPYLKDHAADFRLGQAWGIHLNDRADHYCRRWDVTGENSSRSFSFYDPPALGDAMYLEELRHFLLCVETGRPTAIPFSDGLRVVEICERVKELANR